MVEPDRFISIQGPSCWASLDGLPLFQGSLDSRCAYIAAEPIRSNIARDNPSDYLSQAFSPGTWNQHAASITSWSSINPSVCTNFSSGFSAGSGSRSYVDGLRAVDALVGFADAKATEELQQSLSEWLKRAVDRYSLSSKEQFWTFLDGLRARIGGDEPQPTFLPDSLQWGQSWSLANSAMGATIVNPALRDVELWDSHVIVSQQQIQTIWSDLIKQLDRDEPAPAEILKELYSRLKERLAERAKLVSHRSDTGGAHNLSFTRDALLSFRLRSGTPPPAGIALYLVTASSSGRDTMTERGGQNEAVCQRRSRRGVSHRLQQETEEAHRAESALVDACAYGRTYVVGRRCLRPDREVARRPFWPARGRQMVHHFHLGAVDWRV